MGSDSIKITGPARFSFVKKKKSKNTFRVLRKFLKLLKWIFILIA